MKAKVIIENGETTIILTPENEFEIDVIEKVLFKKEKHLIHTYFDAQYNYGTYSKHKIELSIKEKQSIGLLLTYRGFAKAELNSTKV